MFWGTSTAALAPATMSRRGCEFPSTAERLETTVTLPERGERNREFTPRLCVAWFAGDVDASIKARLHDFGAHVPPLPPWGGMHRGPHEGKLLQLGVFCQDMRSLELLQAPTTS